MEPYTSAKRLPKGKNDPAFRTKPQIAVELVDAALEAGIVFRAMVADCLRGDNPTFEGTLAEATLPFVLGVKPSTSIWAPEEEAHSPKEAVAELAWEDPEDPGDWTKVERRFRDGHTEVWWAVDLRYGLYGPDQPRRMVVATTDPKALPDRTTWYLTTNLPHPDHADRTEIPFAPSALAEVVRLSALRNWVERSYREVKQELGWAHCTVRRDQAIRRHWAMVFCAFSFCWRHWSGPPAEAADWSTLSEANHAAAQEAPAMAREMPAAASTGRGENGARAIRRALLAPSAPPVAQLGPALGHPHALVARVVQSASASGLASPFRLVRRWTPPQPISPCLTKYR
jgi:hypothetical protein